MNILIVTSAVRSSTAGVMRFLIMFIFLMLAFWGVNMFRHIKGGRWNTFQKITDIIGIVFFIAVIIILIIPGD